MNVLTARHLLVSTALSASVSIAAVATWGWLRARYLAYRTTKNARHFYVDSTGTIFVSEVINRKRTSRLFAGRDEQGNHVVWAGDAYRYTKTGQRLPEGQRFTSDHAQAAS